LTPPPAACFLAPDNVRLADMTTMGEIFEELAAVGRPPAALGALARRRVSPGVLTRAAGRVRWLLGAHRDFPLRNAGLPLRKSRHLQSKLGA